MNSKWIYYLCPIFFNIAWGLLRFWPTCFHEDEPVCLIWNTSWFCSCSMWDLSSSHVFVPFHRCSGQSKVDISQFTSLEPCRNGWQKEVSYQSVDRWYEIQSANMHCPMLCIWESSKKVWALASLSSQAVQNTPIGRGYALMFWVFPQNAVAGSCWHADARPQDPICAKEYFPSFLNISWIWWNW